MSEQINPYVGPRAFNTGETLYGRDRELRVLSALLIAERIVLLHSPSGAGKTSLVRAGLLPRLVEEDFRVLPVVRVNVEPPEGAPPANRYLLSTLLTLEEAFPAQERLPLEQLAAFSLEDYLDQRTEKDIDTLLVFDQFEEVLTIAPADQESKQAFFNEVGSALRNKKRWALFSMREDYIGALTPYLRPIPNRLVTRFRLDLLGAEAASLAVQKPAKAAGFIFNPEAAQKLVDDLRSVKVKQPDGSVITELGLYVEPVQLQVVCYRLWEKKHPQDTEISLKDLETVGDVNESLAGYYALSASRVAETSGFPERSIREWFERKLITPDGIRGQVLMGTEASDGLPNAAVRLLENAHIIRSEQRSGQIWFELAHDRLIEPVRTDNRDWFQRNLSLFQRQASLWLQRDRSEGLLLRGHELELAEQEVRQIKPTEDEQSFLQACRLRKRREERDRAQRRWIMAGLAASLVMFFIAIFFALTTVNSNVQLKGAISLANAANTQAYEQQKIAELASTQAVENANAAYAASTQAYNAKATAEKARNDAVLYANAAATAQAKAYAEKANADAQGKIAVEQSRLAQSIALVAQSLLARNQTDEKLANLFAAAAFSVADNARTRAELLVSLATRNLLYMDQSQPSGQTTDLGFASGGRLVSSNFYNCPGNDYYLCSGVIKIWDINPAGNASGVADAILQPENEIKAAGMLDASAVSPDGKTIATASCDPVDNNIVRCEDETIQFWDVETRQPEKQSITLAVGNEFLNEKTVQLQYSPDGGLLALSYNNPNIFNANPNTKPMLIVWNTQTLQEMGRLQTGNGVSQMAFSRDGKSLAYVSGKSLVLVDLTNMEKKEIASPGGETGILLSLAYSPNGKLLAVGDADGHIRLLDTGSYQRVGAPLVYISKVLALVFSPDNQTLAAGHFDATINLWDVSSQTKMIKKSLFKHFDPANPDDFPIYVLTFSPDGKALASSSNEIILWDMDKKSWAAKACSIAGRNFSQAEWGQNFPGDDYRSICPAFPAGK